MFVPALVFVPKKQVRERKPTSVNLPPDLNKRLDRIAEDLGLRSRSALIVEVLENWLKEYEAEKQSKK
jgi:metal-responsive CopG/Arc/MetJ family transcriptional regulator